MTKSRPSILLNAQIRAEATEWLLRFSEEEIDARAREEFSHWLRASPEHVRAYLRISAFWQEADHIDGKSTPRDVESLVASAKLEANVFPLEFGPHPSAREAAGRSVSSGLPKRLYWTVAATFLLTVGIGATTWYYVSANPSYSTDIGEQRTVNLPDGSTVTINANSTIKVAYTDAARAIELREGQALFKVAKNPARPFIVRSGAASIRAVGTQFDVYKKDTGTIVTVVEGKVAVGARASASASPPNASFHQPKPREGRQEYKGEVFLVAGEQLTISLVTPGRSGFQLSPKSVKLAEATAWTSGILVFDGAPLSEVIQEFNRQNTKPLVLIGADLSALKISGTFPASGSDRIVHFLQERFQVAVRETKEEIQVSRP